MIAVPGLITISIGAAVLAIDRIIAWVGGDLDVGVRTGIHSVAESVFWICCAWMLSRLVDAYIWLPITRRREHPAPRLLVAVVRLLILALAVAAIVTIVFKQPLTGLLVSSGVVGIVLGFALQRMISDFFSGIALSLEAPFNMGDWIEIDGRAGRVVETNWRATRLITLERTTIILPNSYIAERRVENFGKKSDVFRTEVQVSLEYSVAPQDAKRVLLAAVRAVEGILPEPEPDILLADFGNDGIIYRVRFYLNSYKELEATRDRVNMAIARQLWQAGYNVPYPKRDVYHAQMPPRQISRRDERDALLARVELFEPLEMSELSELAKSVKEHECKAGEEVVAQGDEGVSLFVVVDGLLEARVASNGSQKTLGRIGAGEFFGEMSLLTGSPRGATVIAVTDATLYELSRDVIEPIIQRRPQVAEAISQVIATRRVRNDKALATADAASRQKEQRTFAQDLLGRIRWFFRIE